MRIILLSIFIFLAGVFANAQPGTSLITGTVGETVNAELALYKTLDKKTEMVAAYKISSTHRDFAFAFPVEKEASYKLAVRLMKQGHLRLELDRAYSFPLQLKAGQNVVMKITPSTLDEGKRKGIELRNTAGYNDVSFVSGNLTNSRVGGAVSICRVVNGHLEELASSNTTKRNKRFQLAIPLKKEGFYYLTSVRWRCRLYLKPADKLELNVNALSGQYELINGSDENRLLEAWQTLSLPITEYGYNRTIFQNDSLQLENYISAYEKLQPAIGDFKSQNNLSNDHFNRLFDLAIDLDNEFAPIYLFSCLSARRPGKFASVVKKFNEPPAFYKQFIQPGKFGDAAMLQIGEGISFINQYQKLNLAFLPEESRKSMSGSDRMKIMMDAIANDTLKEFFLKEQLEKNDVNNLSEFRSTFQPFEKYATTTQVRKKYDHVYQQFIGDTAWLGRSSYNFSVLDTSGKSVSMKDFRGKVVFIDVWATWCGPCREQLPYLKEIEEEYKDNNDIVFMGISIDRAKDEEKWLRFIQKEKLQGVQLLDNSKEFRQRYDISSIPRFLLIDKQGNWVEVRCPRPSSKEDLKRYLDSALQNGITNSN